MRVGSLCNRIVSVATKEDSVTHVAQLMRNHHVGCVIIIDQARCPIGLVTDRDLVLALAECRDPHLTTACDVMTWNIHCAAEDMDSSDVLELMRAHGIRRVPVVNGNQVLQGMFTFDDALRSGIAELNELKRALKREWPQERARERTSELLSAQKCAASSPPR